MWRILYVIILFLFSSCMNAKKEKILELLQEWEGREIVYPPDIIFTIQGGDTLQFDSLKYRYTVLTYVDSIGCISCKLNFRKWMEFASEVDSIAPNSVCMQFVFQPYRVNELLLTLKQYKFMLPMCVDEMSQFGNLNKFPMEVEFHSFILDNRNKVVAIGDPTLNSQIKKLYLNIIQGKNVKSENIENNIVQTTVKLDRMSVLLNDFDWQKEQKVTFTLKNTGDKPLVIEDVHTSCGCTTVEFEKEPVRPGVSLDLHVTYKAEHPGHFNKTITVHCNVESSPIKLTISGNAQ